MSGARTAGRAPRMRSSLWVLGLMVGCGEAPEPRAPASEFGADGFVGGVDPEPEAADGCPLLSEEDGFIAVEAPRPATAAECPSGRWLDGLVCAPQRLRFEAWACAPGWDSVAYPVEVAEDLIEEPRHLEACRAPALPQCEPGTLALPGRGQCVQQGPRCPEGEGWHDEAAIRALAPGFEGRVLYAAASAAPGGEGSRRSPWALAEAVSVAEAGDIVAVGVGSHDALIWLDKPVALVGACVAGTTLRAEAPQGEDAIVNIQGEAGVRLTALTLQGPLSGLRVHSPVQPVSIVDVSVREVSTVGIRINGAGELVSMERVDIQRVEPGGGAGHGLLVREGALVQARDCLVVGTAGVGVLVTGQGSTLDLSDSLVRTAADSGLVAQSGARAAVARVLVEDTLDMAVFVFGGGSILEAEDLEISGTRPSNADSFMGYGLIVQEGHARLKRATLRHNTNGIYVQAAGSVVELEDVWILDTERPLQPHWKLGWGINANSWASVQLKRVAVNNSQFVGIHAAGLSSFDAEDVLITETGGRGLEFSSSSSPNVNLDSRGQVRRAVISGALEVGVIVLEEGSALDMQDVVIERTDRRRVREERGAAGIVVESDAQLQARRILLRDLKDIGVRVNAGGVMEAEDLALIGVTGRPAPEFFNSGVLVFEVGTLSISRGLLKDADTFGVVAAGPGTRLDLRDFRVRDTHPESGVGALGRGLQAQELALVKLERVEVVDNYDTGVFSSFGAILEARDLLVHGTMKARCHTEPEGCVGNAPLGVGLAVLDEGRAQLERFLLTNNAEVGLFIAVNGDVSASCGAIMGHEIGVVLQDAEVNIEEALQHTFILDNGQSVSFEDQPLPDSRVLLPSP